MATIKNYTDINQSKKLAEILPLESADMLFQLGEDKYADSIRAPLTKEHWEQMMPDIKPCWSLSALLELMPQRIVGPFGELWHLGLEKDWDKVSYIVYYENKNSFVQRKAKDPIDACIEMIEWLIKNGHKHFISNFK